MANNVTVKKPISVGSPACERHHAALGIPGSMDVFSVERVVVIAKFLRRREFRTTDTEDVAMAS
ncbi:MAG: hypothetical protein M0Z39_04700, partial [Actinomycetota bacterium]|nr:hypothetical protein [Actinomycetota bacterium]